MTRSDRLKALMQGEIDRQQLAIDGLKGVARVVLTVIEYGQKPDKVKIEMGTEHDARA